MDLKKESPIFDGYFQSVGTQESLGIEILHCFSIQVLKQLNCKADGV